MKKIIRAIEWLILAEWYDGEDLGDGIFVTMLSIMFFSILTIAAISLLAFTLLK